MSKFTQKHAQISFCSKLNTKSAMNFKKKSNPQNKNLQKTSKFNRNKPKIKQSASLQAIRKTNPPKNKPKFAGKPQGWQH